MADGSAAQAATARYGRKREAIVAAATEVLNRRGVKGMTLALVAGQVGLITTSVTYYFKKKEDLAAACFLGGIERLDLLVAEAARAPDVSARLLRLLELYLDLRLRIRTGEAAAIPVFSDIRALTGPLQASVVEAYRELFMGVRGLLAPTPKTAAAATANTQMILEQLHWLAAWLPRYDAEDFPRVRDRMHDILMHGLAVDGAAWDPASPPPLAARPAADALRDTFLLAGTRLINQQGYRGASVEKISASLNVTKGSFYHHHSAKDDVVVSCFHRSFDVIRGVQTAARSMAGDQWLRLSSAAAALIEFQMSEQGPLLRASALAALPETIREAMVEQSSRISERWAAMISDGIAEGSIRPVDPYIGAQMLGATLNAAADLRVLLEGTSGRDVADLYLRPMMMGLSRP